MFAAFFHLIAVPGIEPRALHMKADPALPKTGIFTLCSQARAPAVIHVSFYQPKTCVLLLILLLGSLNFPAGSIFVLR